MCNNYAVLLPFVLRALCFNIEQKASTPYMYTVMTNTRQIKIFIFTDCSYMARNIDKTEIHQ